MRAAILAGLTASAIAIAVPAHAQGSDVRNARAAFVYMAQATQNAAVKAMDNTIVSHRRRIDALNAQLVQSRAALKSASGNVGALKTKLAALEDEASAAQERFTSELAKRDADYAAELATLRGAADAILATPDGLRALELNNAGDWEGAKRVEAALRAARQKARDQAAAADARAFAVLALDNRNKRRETTAAVIVRYEEIVALDPGRCGDWLTLGALYEMEARPDRALAAMDHCLRMPATPNERVRLLTAKGEIVRRTDMRAALGFFRQAAEIAAAEPDPDPRIARANLTGATGLAGDAMFALGDKAGAEAQYRKVLAALEKARADGADAMILWQLSTVHERLGMIQGERGDNVEAAKSLEAALSLRTELVKRAPDRVMYRQGLSDIDWRFGRIIARGDPAKAIGPFGRSVAIMRTLVEADPNVRFRRQLAERLGDLARSQDAAGKPAEAAASRAEAAAIMKPFGEAK